MVETLTESFCERCGTRYEFKAPTRLNPLRKTRGLFGGLKNYLTSQDALSDAIGDAMRSEEDQLASAQLEAFHESFNFCIGCRQYTCLNCWNDGDGRCRSCAPIPGTDDLAERLAASLSATGATGAVAEPPLVASSDAAATVDGAQLSDADQGRLGLDAWPSSDPVAPSTANGHVDPAADAAWPEHDDVTATRAETLDVWADPAADAWVEAGAGDASAAEPETMPADPWPTPEEDAVAATSDADAAPRDDAWATPQPAAAAADEWTAVSSTPDPWLEPVAEAGAPEVVAAEQTEPEMVVAGDVEPDVVLGELDETEPAAAGWDEPEPVAAEWDAPDPVAADWTHSGPVAADAEAEAEPVAATEPEPLAREPEPVAAEYAWPDAFAAEQPADEGVVAGTVDRANLEWPAEPEEAPALGAMESEPVVAERARLHVVAWEEDAAYDVATPELAAVDTEPELAPAASVEPPVAEPEPIVAVAEPVLDPEPMVATTELDPEPALAQIEPPAEPVLAKGAPEAIEPEPFKEPSEPPLETVAAEADAEPAPAPQPTAADPERATNVPAVEPTPTPAEPPVVERPRIAPIRETILPFPGSGDAHAPAAPKVAAADESPEVAARRAQLDLLGLGDPGEGPVASERPAVLPYRSRGAAVSQTELAMRAAQSGFWEASAREVAGAAANIGVQNCGQCGLSLSASARFCRRCGTRQARSA